MSKTISKSLMKSMLLVLILAATSTMATAAMTVSTLDSSGDSGTTVQIPVTLSDAPTLGSLGFTLTYDSSVLTNTGYTTGDIFAAGSMKVVNNGTAGTIIASVINTDGINTADSGSILVFTFTVTGTTGETSDLALSSVSASDTSAAVVATGTSSGIFTVTGVPTGMGVITPDSSGDSGTIVQIPVDLSDAPTLGSLGFTLTYDSSVLTNTGYTTGDIFAAGSMKVVNNGTPGTIIASVINTDGINTADSGSILVFTFTVTGSTGETSDLALSSVSASDTSAAPVETYTSSGTFTVGAAAPTLTWQTEPPTSVTQGNDVTFDVIFSESADYYFRVENSTNGVVWRYPTSGTYSAANPGERTWPTTADTPTGDYTIIININGADNSDTKTVTVTEAGAAPTLASITISPPSCMVNVGGSRTFTAVCKDTTGAEMTCPTLTWTSSNETVGTITSEGVFTAAMIVGTTTVTAENGTVNDTASVTVATVRPVTLVHNSNNLGYNYIAWTGSVETNASALADMIIADAGAGVVPDGTAIAYYNTTDGIWHGFLVGINDPGSEYDFAISQYGVISIKVSAEGTFQMPLP